MNVIHGDCLEEMRKMESNSISAIVTDPPYGLHFMGKEWDAGLPDHDIWKEALRIAKPGSFLLSFGGTRTYHRLTCAIEDAGWEIRDCLMWLYGSGFPKSHNHFGVEGYGTALKPAYEPIIMAMKKCDGTFKQNAEKWGQSGINIDGCRIPTEDCLAWGARSPTLELHEGWDRPWRHNEEMLQKHIEGRKDRIKKAERLGRWPANILFDEAAAARLGEPSRFFYCAKASKSERNEGLEGMPDRIGGGMCSTVTGHVIIQKNNHPTVKPLKLMEYLIRMIMPPKDGILLDPFSGSGTTIIAAHNLGLEAIGIEKSSEYCEIARKRVQHYSCKSFF